MPGVRALEKQYVCRAHPHLFEINTWAWLETLSRDTPQPLTLAGVPDREWDALRDLGFDLIWLMGVWKRSSLGRYLARTMPEKFPEYDAALPGWALTHIVGSPYSIQDYQPDPRMGTLKELQSIHRKLNSRGMGLILDFVPNHTGLDHPWVTSHPEYYVCGSQEDFRRDPDAFYLAEHGSGQIALVARGKDPYFPPWPDVAQLNYFNPRLRAAMIGELQKIAHYCDGVRCDMAMLLLNEVFARTWGSLLRGFAAPESEFWPEAIATAPGLIWIAEVYWEMEWRLQQMGFQYAYDKRLYDRLRAAAAPHEVYLHLKADWTYQKSLLRFLENHDEQRSASVFGTALPAVIALTATLPGMRFYHQGQLDGRRHHLPVALSNAADEPIETALRNFYAKILALSNEEVFHSGQWRLLDTYPSNDSGSFQQLIAHQWRGPSAWKVVVVNLAGEAASCRLRLESDTSGNYLLRDELTGSTYLRDGAEVARQGLYIRLEANQAHVFDLRLAN